MSSLYITAPRSAQSAPPLRPWTTWQKPLPPVRFPLRDALLSAADTSGNLSARSAAAQSQALSQKGPLKVQWTKKAKAARHIGQLRRQGVASKEIGRAPWEPKPIEKPVPPPDRPVSAPRMLATEATLAKQKALYNAQHSGKARWMVGMEESASAPSLLMGEQPAEVRSTWTSAARAVLSHQRRLEAAAEQAEKSGEAGGGSHGNSPRGGDQTAASKSMASSASISSHSGAAKKMPREVSAWLEKGLEFTDGGLGVGDRFGLDHVFMARRAPGPGAYEHPYGNIALWNHEAPLPTKQPYDKYPSCEARPAPLAAAAACWCLLPATCCLMPAACICHGCRCYL